MEEGRIKEIKDVKGKVRNTEGVDKRHTVKMFTTTHEGLLLTPRKDPKLQKK